MTARHPAVVNTPRSLTWFNLRNEIGLAVGFRPSKFPLPSPPQSREPLR